MAGINLKGIFGLVDGTPCLDWIMCPLTVSYADGKYVVALVRVSPGQVQ